jgi:hypothetical protein
LRAGAHKDKKFVNILYIIYFFLHGGNIPPALDAGIQAISALPDIGNFCFFLFTFIY